MYDSLDFDIYRGGGDAVTHDARLYLAHIHGHWFTYPPFAAVTFTMLTLLPAAIARVLWELASVAALATSCTVTLKLAGWRVSRTAVATATAGSLALEPVYHTLFQGQINLFLLALLLTDVWRASRFRGAGIGTGLAAALKLTPAIFILLFLFAKRPRQALTAAVTFAACGFAAYLVAPGASRLYWSRLFYDTKRVGAPYISNQSPYGAVSRFLGGAAHVGAWYAVAPLTIGIAGLAVATVFARRGDWLSAASLTGVTGLLVSPISWTHHWVWIVPVLALLARGGTGSRIASVCGYVLFAAAPMWWTPHSGGPREYGFHGLLTLAANCYLAAGLAFLAFMTWRAHRAGGPADRRTSPPLSVSGSGRHAALAGAGPGHTGLPGITRSG